MATNDKYDRQLRLWGPIGQRNLSRSHILLIHADAVGAETMKNLVLPGIGAFTVLDDHRVSESDLGNNFFVTSDSIGRPRAEVVTENLCEMNADVRGYARVGNFVNVFKTEPHFFDQFTIIITANLSYFSLEPLARRCWERNIPLLVVTSRGLVGALQLQVREHFVSEVRGDIEHFDLRITAPFPELQSLCESIYPSSKRILLQQDSSTEDSVDTLRMDSMQYAHIPYPVLLLRALEQWRMEEADRSENAMPSTYAEKQRLKSILKSFELVAGQRNVAEAIKEASRCFVSHRITALTDLAEDVDEVEAEDHLTKLTRYIRELRSMEITSSEPSHRLLLRALDRFVALHDSLPPLSGKLPDLTATSDYYRDITRTFQQQAAFDRDSFAQILAQILSENNLPLDYVSVEEVSAFCKNALSASVVRTSDILHPKTNCVANALQVDDLYEDPQQTALLFWLALRAADSFFAEYGRMPGDDVRDDDVLRSDVEAVFQELKRLALEVHKLPPHIVEGSEDKAMEMEDENVSQSDRGIVSRALAQEVVRSGGLQLHNVSALLGGIAAQEAVKLVTHIFMPLDNLYVFNGVASVGATYRM